MARESIALRKKKKKELDVPSPSGLRKLDRKKKREKAYLKKAERLYKRADTMEDVEFNRLPRKTGLKGTVGWLEKKAYDETGKFRIKRLRKKAGKSVKKAKKIQYGKEGYKAMMKREKEGYPNVWKLHKKGMYKASDMPIKEKKRR